MLAATFHPAPPLPHALDMFGDSPLLGPRALIGVASALRDPARRDQMIAILTTEVGPRKTRDILNIVEGTRLGDAVGYRELSGVFGSLAWLVGTVVVTGLLVVGGVVVYRNVRRRA